MVYLLHPIPLLYHIQGISTGPNYHLIKTMFLRIRGFKNFIEMGQATAHSYVGCINTDFHKNKCSPYQA